MGTCGLGVDVRGLAIAPTAPRLMTPPAMTPILTFRLSAFHVAFRPVPFDVGIRYGRGGCGLFELEVLDMSFSPSGALLKN